MQVLNSNNAAAAGTTDYPSAGGLARSTFALFDWPTTHSKHVEAKESHWDHQLREAPKHLCRSIKGSCPELPLLRSATARFSSQAFSAELHVALVILIPQTINNGIFYIYEGGTVRRWHSGEEGTQGTWGYAPQSSPYKDAVDAEYINRRHEMVISTSSIHSTVCRWADVEGRALSRLQTCATSS